MSNVKAGDLAAIISATMLPENLRGIVAVLSARRGNWHAVCAFRYLVARLTTCDRAK
jgi:hypothetical protein